MERMLGLAHVDRQLQRSGTSAREAACARLSIPGESSARSVLVADRALAQHEQRSRIVAGDEADRFVERNRSAPAPFFLVESEGGAALSYTG
jgi:hypothetical protein